MAVKKHSDLTNQADLHEPKLHKASHEAGALDAIDLNEVGTTENTTTKVLQPTGAGKTQWNTAVNLDGKLENTKSIQTASDRRFYIGDSSTNGSWRISRNNPSGSNEISFEKRVAGSYVSQGSFPTSVTGLEVQTFANLCFTKLYGSSTNFSYPNVDDRDLESYYNSSGWGNPAIDSSVANGSNWQYYTEDLTYAWACSGGHITHSDTVIHSVRAMGGFSGTAGDYTAYLFKFAIPNNSSTSNPPDFTCVGKVSVNPSAGDYSYNVTGTVSAVVIPAGYGLVWLIKNGTSSTYYGTHCVSAKVLVP